MIKINLIPPEYLEKLNRKAVVAKAIFAGVISAVLVFLLSAWHFNRARRLEVHARQLEAELMSLQGDVDKAKAIESQIAEVQRYLNSIGSITRGRLLYPHFMQDLLVNLPGTIWFGGVNTTLKAETLNINLTVNSYSTYDLAYWINALETDPKYADVTLGGISVSAGESGKTLATNMTMKYTYK